MTSPQQIFNNLSRAYCLEQADKVVAECKECGGHGRLPVTPQGCLPPDHDRDCNRCTPEAEEWRKLADEFIWHEPIYAWCADNLNISMQLATAMNNVGYNPPMFYHINTDHGGIECSCGKSHMNRKFRSFNEPDRVLRDIGLHNPTYDNPADIANALKRMGLFERFVPRLNFNIGNQDWGEELPTSFILDKIDLQVAEILLNPALFIEAGINFLREVVGQP